MSSGLDFRHFLYDFVNSSYRTRQADLGRYSVAVSFSVFFILVWFTIHGGCHDVKKTSFFPIEVEQHQTFRTPSIATGLWADNDSPRPLLTGSGATALSRKSCEPYCFTAPSTHLLK
jgi:hypothetical protein